MTALATRPSLPRRLWRAVRIAWLNFEIRSAEEWVGMCQREGISGTESVKYQRGHIEALRVQLIQVEASA